MTKPRIRATTDGRIGWPAVVQYEMLDGPKAGRRLTCPPTVGRDLDPATRLFQHRSHRYRLVIHDKPAYDQLVWSGAIHDPRHTGAGRAVDNRSAPGA